MSSVMLTAGEVRALRRYLAIEADQSLPDADRLTVLLEMSRVLAAALDDERPDLDESVALPEFPTRPSDLPDAATLGELLASYHGHLLAVVGSRGPVELMDSFTAQHALAALATAQAVVDTFVSERWQLVRDALASGATVDEVGAALGGLEVDEVAAGLTSWADREHRAGGLSLDDYDAVIALIAGGAR